VENRPQKGFLKGNSARKKIRCPDQYGQSRSCYHRKQKLVYYINELRHGLTRKGQCKKMKQTYAVVQELLGGERVLLNSQLWHAVSQLLRNRRGEKVKRRWLRSGGWGKEERKPYYHRGTGPRSRGTGGKNPLKGGGGGGGLSYTKT